MEAVEEAFNKDEVMEIDLGREDTEMAEEMVEEEITEEEEITLEIGTIEEIEIKNHRE